MHNDMTGQKFNMLTIIEDSGGGVVKVRRKSEKAAIKNKPQGRCSGACF